MFVYIGMYLYFFLLIFLKTTLKASRRGESNIVCVYHVGLFFAYKQLVHLSLVFGKSSKRLKRDLTSSSSSQWVHFSWERSEKNHRRRSFFMDVEQNWPSFFPLLAACFSPSPYCYIVLHTVPVCNRLLKKRLCWKWITSHKYLQAMLNGRYVSIEVVCIIVF